MSEIDKALHETQAYEELRAAHNRALRTLAKREGDQAELVEAVYRAAKDAALGMNPTFDQLRFDRGQSTETLTEWCRRHEPAETLAGVDEPFVAQRFEKIGRAHV